MTQHIAHDTNEMPTLNPGLFLPPRPRRWPIILAAAVILTLAAAAAVFYLQARGLQETVRTAAAKLNDAEDAKKAATTKISNLESQVNDFKQQLIIAQHAEERRCPVATSTKKSAIKADNAKDDTTVVVTIADDKLGLIETCKVPAKEQSEFLRTTLRLNKGEGKVRDGRTVEDLSDLDEVFPGENWTVLGRLCHRE